MAAPAPSDKVKDKEYANWLKVTLALYYMKSGLHTFIQSEVDCLHQSLVQKIYGGQTVPLPPCTICHASHVKRNKYTGAWAFQKQCRSYCDAWLYELLKLHTNPKSDIIYWDNSHVPSWPFKPWECGKVFMPRGQLPSNTRPTDCDAQALLTLLANCTHFHRKLSTQGLGLTHTISTIRNKVVHDGEMKLSDADRMSFIQQIVQLLEDPVSLKSLEDCKAAVINIHKIDNESVDVFFNIDLEMIAIRAGVNDLRQELGMQETKYLDNINSLKEEFKEQTKRFEDVEKKLKLHGESTTNRFEVVEKKLELHGQSTTKRFDDTEKKLELHGDSTTSRFEDVEKRLELHQESTTNKLEVVEKKLELHGQSTTKRFDDAEKKLELHGDSTTSRFEDVEKRLELHGESTTNRFEVVEKKLELHGQSTTKRFDDTEKKLELHGDSTTSRFEDVEKRLELHQESTTNKLEVVEKKLELHGQSTTKRFDDAEKKLELHGDSTTSRFEDVEKRLELHGESTTNRFEVVEKKLELHGQSTTKRFDDAEKKLELHGESTANRFDIVEKKFELHGQSTTSRFEDIEELHGERVDALEEKIGKLQDEIGQMTREKETSTKRRPESDGLRQLKNQTEDSLDTFRKKGFITTVQTKEAKKLLQEKGSIVIKGNPGEGKTSTALHLIDNNDYRNQRVVVNNPRQWETVDTEWLKIVVLEDIFGQYDLDRVLLQEWLNKYLRIIQNHVDVGKLQVIITIRDDILLKAYSKLKSFKLFFSEMSLTLSSEKLKNSDKMSILDRNLQRNNKDMDVDEKEQCIANFSGLIGFPQCCSLFAGDTDLFGQGPEFFKSPEKFLVDNITNLYDNSFLSLAFLFCIGEIEEEYLSLSEKKNFKKYLPALEDLASYLNISFNESNIILLRDSYDHFSGLYVNKVFSYGDHSGGTFSHEHHSGGNVRKSCIQFSHGTVYEAVGQVLGDRCPELVVKYGESGYLYQRTYTAEAKDSASQNVFIPVSVYGLLVQRMIDDVVRKQLVKRVVKHSALRQHYFLMTLKDELHKRSRITDLFKASTLYNRQDLSEGKCFTFLQYILQNDKDIVRFVFSLFLEFLTCMHNNNNSSNCWQCKEKHGLLELSLYYHHFEIADKLINMNACYTHISLCNAARYDDPSRVQTVLEYLKKSLVFNPECTEAKKALCRAYISGNQDIIEILLQEGITLDSMHVVNVVQHGDINVLMTVVEHLKCHNKWNPHEEQYNTYFQTCVFSDVLDLIHGPKCHFPEVAQIPCSIALYITYFNEKFDMADYLLKNEAKVSLHMMAYASEYSSVQAVASVIQNLKVTGDWDPHCDDASKALEKAYSENKCDVHDLLILEGVSLTMKNFPGVVKGVLVSLESVKKALQHLKDTNSWDPKCYYTFQALKKAYMKQKEDVCHLLVQEGVSLTMKELSGVIMESLVSFETVKMIIQHLKDSDSWDPKCGDASKALEKAYSEDMYDVCDLLVQEGVSIRMKHLPYIILRSLDYVKTSVKHLKDSDSWDPKCGDASQALEKAYSEDMYDVCDLLVQEGVSLRMKHLPHIILRSLDYVKTSVKQLKDTDIWDPKCNDAFDALEKAYGKQKYNVCNLLIQEGVSVTMKNLPYMIQRSRSLDYVKTSVNLLKYTDSWDLKCDDASEALEQAYWAQKYDVCDLLVQEGVSLTMKHLPYMILRSLDYVKTSVKHLKYTNSWDPKCDDAFKALEKAYWEQKYDVCDLLVQEGVLLTMKNLLGVIMRGSLVPLESVKKAIQHLKDTNSWDSKCDDASNTLERVYWAQKYDVCELLVQEGVSLTMKNLPGVIMGLQVSLESVKKAMQHLKDTNSWDPNCDDAAEALQMAYGAQLYDVCHQLIQEGVSLTMKNLSGVIMRGIWVSLESVEEAIQHLKGTGYWDPRCDAAYEALVKAYGEKKYDVCGLLIQEGVSLTMKDLPYIILRSLSLEYVNKLVNLLKYRNSWNPQCHDASKALEKAYGAQKDDVCDLLVQEGVSLRIKNLSGIIIEFQVPFKSVMKAIQHLKDTHYWNPNCDDASEALEKAYGAQKYDVCDLLVKKGVSLRMKNLSGIIIEFQVPFKSVMKAIQHLKDTHYWNPNCDDASEALEKAYGAQKYDVCDLLVQEGVSLRMKNLSGIIIEFQVPFKSVMKAIQHLKDTHYWNPNCDDASEALEKAYWAQKYDVCDLLVKKGVLLTMKNLPGVLMESQLSMKSVEEVKIHVTNKDSWDPKCHDASEALAKAYQERKYDVCDLLVQEGVSLTMNNLPGVIMGFQKSLKSVRKAIQQLKDTHIWDPMSYNAYITLYKAYREHQYEVCYLLVQEGVTLPGFMREFQVSLESVEKAIQHLKSTGCWDPKCHDASEALEKACMIQNYDVFDLLVQEGVSLTMKNLPGFIRGFQVSLESVKKAIQHLKSTGCWDPKCHDASKTLQKASRKQKYDVRDLLVHEGVSLTMKNRLGFIRRFLKH